MTEETPITQPTPTPVVPVENRAEDRINQLSDKVKTTATERDAATAKADEAERRAAFAEGFVDIVTTQPAAKDHKDEIREKVLKGYSVQDATFAVLGAAGKLGNAPISTPQVAGGSAATSMPQGAQKEVKDMTLAEKRAQLEKDIVWT